MPVELDVSLQINSRNNKGKYLVFVPFFRYLVCHFLENTHSAAMHVLRVLKEEDPGANLLIYWHYWNATVVEMFEVLKFYKKRVVFGFAPVIIFFL